MPNREFNSTNTSELNECESFLDGTGHRFFEQHIDALTKQVRSYLEMQVSRNYHCNKMRSCLLYHLTVIGVTRHVEPAYGQLQVRFIGLRDAHKLNMLIVEISQYT